MAKLLGSRAFLGSLGKHFFGALGLIWLITEVVNFFLPESPLADLGSRGLLGSIGLSVIAAVAVAWPRKRVSATIPNSPVEVTVRVGDLLDAKENVIVGMSDVFDTRTGEGVISTRSLQAQLVQARFDGDVAAFDAQIDRALTDVPFVVDPSKTKGKNKRYATGTVIQVPAHGIRHYLCAYCRMPATLRAETDVCTLFSSLDNCWARIRDTGDNQGISMAVIGADFGRTGLTHTQLVQLAVLSFIASSKTQHIAPSLTIYVHPSNAGSVDFVALRLWLRGILWA